MESRWVVQLLIGESHALTALELRSGSLVATFAKAEEQGILLQQSAVDVIFLDVSNQALDRAAGCVPDFARGLIAVTAAELVQLQLAVRRQETSAAARGAAADDVLVDEHYFETLAQELRGRGHAGKSASDDHHIAFDMPG